MANLRIAVLGGDGIGPEVIEQAIRVADRAVRLDQSAVEWARLPWNSDHYRQHGRMMPADGLDQLRTYNAILLGAVGWPGIPDNITLNGAPVGAGRGPALAPPELTRSLRTPAGPIGASSGDFRSPRMMDRVVSGTRCTARTSRGGTP